MPVVRVAPRFVCQFAQIYAGDGRHQKGAAAARRAMEEGHGRRNASVGERSQAVFSCDKERGRCAVVFRLPLLGDTRQAAGEDSAGPSAVVTGESTTVRDAGNDADSRAGVHCCSHSSVSSHGALAVQVMVKGSGMGLAECSSGSCVRTLLMAAFYHLVVLLSVFLSSCLLVCPSVCLSVCLSVSQLVSLSV